MNQRPTLPPGHRSLLLGLFLAWLAIAGCLGISPHNRVDWWLEHIVVVVGLAILVITGRWFVFSKPAYLLGFAFLCLHEIGAHHTYSEVPYRDWLPDWLDGAGRVASGAEDRNHFDRLVHFLYGLLLARPWREAYYFAMKPRRDGWSHLVVVSFAMSTSLLYELLEWAAAILYGGEDGMAFLGVQGDIWDAHKDMLLATAGAVVASVAMTLRRVLTGRDPAREWGTGPGDYRREPDLPPTFGRGA